MTGAEFTAIRHRLGLSAYAWAQALAYCGDRNTLQKIISRMERGHRPVPPAIARLARMYERYGVPDEAGFE